MPVRLMGKAYPVRATIEKTLKIPKKTIYILLC
jgi:hypothetical protein